MLEDKRETVERALGVTQSETRDEELRDLLDELKRLDTSSGVQSYDKESPHYTSVLNEPKYDPNNFSWTDTTITTSGSGGSRGSGGKSYHINLPEGVTVPKHLYNEEMKQVIDKFREFGATSKEVNDAFRQVLNNFPLARKRIESINIEVVPTYVDVAKFGEPVPQTIRGETELKITDQDDEPVPDELHERLKEGWFSGELDTATLRRVLDEWNGVKRDPTHMEGMDGHKDACLYHGDHDYPCTCQPPTIWGEVKYYHCDCCEEPRADIHHGLCDLCSEHMNDPGYHAHSEHEVRAMSE